MLNINIKFYYNAQKRDDLTKGRIEKGYLELCRKYGKPCNGSTDQYFDKRIDAMRAQLIKAGSTYEEIVNATTWKHDEVFERVICI